MSVEKRINILNVPFDVVTLDDVAARLMVGVGGDGYNGAEREQRGLRVFTPNPEMLLETRRNEYFLKVLQRGDVNIPDGAGIVWAARYLGVGELPERVTGTDLMQELCKRAADIGAKVFLLGAAAGVAEKTRDVLQQRHPALNVCGTYSGSPRDADYPEIRRRIQAAAPDILFVAYGAPAQELWIDEHIDDFPTLHCAIGVGGAFDFISGKRKRAPQYMRTLSLEWLFRLVQQPSRIKRIFNAVVRFPFMVVSEGTSKK